MAKTWLGPYINFGGRAREALEHYQSALGGELDLQTVEGGGARLAGAGDRIAHGRLVADGMLIVGSDGHPSYPAQTGDNVAITVVGADRERLARAFERLADGGQVKMPLTRQAWGEAGWLTDRFGINWNFDIELS